MKKYILAALAVIAISLSVTSPVFADDKPDLSAGITMSATDANYVEADDGDPATTENSGIMSSPDSGTTVDMSGPSGGSFTAVQAANGDKYYTYTCPDCGQVWYLVFTLDHSVWPWIDDKAVWTLYYVDENGEWVEFETGTRSDGQSNWQGNL